MWMATAGTIKAQAMEIKKRTWHRTAFSKVGRIRRRDR
jgi:hypothetical protein